MVVCQSQDVELHVETIRYRVLGASWGALRCALGVVGPKRKGRVYAAFTDWRVRWEARATVCEGIWRADGIRVRVETQLTLPEWRAPLTAPSALVERWQNYLAALEAHEQGHIDIAEKAGTAVAAALRGVRGCASERQFSVQVKTSANDAIEVFRQDERRYDDWCQRIVGVEPGRQYGDE